MRKNTRRTRGKIKHNFLIFNLGVLLLVAGTLLYLLFFTLTPNLETELRAEFGSAFFDDFAGNLPAAENGGTELEEVTSKYEPYFANLQEEALNRLEELYREALSEYEQQKKDGTLNRPKFINKYIQAGKLLEKQVDSAFYTLLNQLEEELSRKNLPLEIAEEIETTYTGAKEEKKKELFERLRSNLQN